MSRPTSNLRLFLAVYPPAEIAMAMMEAMRSLSLPSFRETPIEQIHLTLQFIGDTPSAAMEETIESVRRSAAGLKAFSLAPQRLLTLPERGPARLVAAETDAPATLMELQRRLAMRLARNARDKPGDRFRPHLTLCRFGAPRHGVKIDEVVEVAPFEVERVALMRSTLTPAGAQHFEVMACALDA